LSLALLVFSAHVSAQAAPTPPASSLIAKLNAFIPKALKQYRVPGAAVAVVQGGKVVLLKGYGVRNIATGAPVNANTIFQVASVSKTFTAALAATLVDAGKLSWDTPIINYLPKFVDYSPYATRHMTMRDLLAMRTGWPQFTGDMLDPFGYSRAEILERLRYLKPAYSLREVSQYSNLGYFVAGQVEASVGGSSWNTLMEERVLKPLDMTRTGTSVHDLADPNSAVSHTTVDNKVVPTQPSNQDTMGAAGSITSTAADLAHLLEALLGDGSYAHFLKPDTIKEMFAPSMVGEVEFTELPPISDKTGFFYGLGVDSYYYAGHHIIEKAGALAGVRSVFTLIPDMDAGIVVLSNLNLTSFPEVVRAFYIENLLRQSPDKDLQEIAARNVELEKLFAPPAPPANPGTFGAPLQALVGVYENDLYGRCEISQQDSGLQLSCGPAPLSVPLEHWQNGEFIARWPGATNIPDDITFTIGADGTADSFTSGALGFFTRVPASQ
jgi:CubicO group peptidase (beta-lactamase class C family)